MKMRAAAVLLTMCGAMAAAPAKNKKDAPPPQLFCQARSVYVQTAEGDPMRPQTAPEDRAAAHDLVAQLQNWKRYTVVTEPQQADLVWVVRTGRAAMPGGNGGGFGANAGSANQDAGGMSANPNGGNGNGMNPASPGMSRGGAGNAGGPGGMSPGDSMGADSNRGGAGAGSPDDVLAIYQRPNGEPLSSPLWQKNQHNGLQSPKMALFEQIRAAVDAACAAPAAPAQTGASAQ
jgi:hypothetical protein